MKKQPQTYRSLTNSAAFPPIGIQSQKLPAPRGFSPLWPQEWWIHPNFMHLFLIICIYFFIAFEVRFLTFLILLLSMQTTCGCLESFHMGENCASLLQPIQSDTLALVCFIFLLHFEHKPISSRKCVSIFYLIYSPLISTLSQAL